MKEDRKLEKKEKKSGWGEDKDKRKNNKFVVWRFIIFLPFLKL